MARKEGNNKVASMFIKGVKPKKGEAMKPKEIPTEKVKITNKKWEPKKGGNPKDLELSNNVPKRLDEKIPKMINKHDKNHQNLHEHLEKHP